MKCAVLHVNSSSLASTSPTMRIAKFVAEELKCHLIHDRQTALARKDEKYDVLFVKHGMLKFSQHRDEALRIYERARRIVNLENDYTFVPDKRFRPADETWSTVEGRTRYVNWNVLTRLPLDAWRSRQPKQRVTHQGVVYYGACRDGRAKYFKQYFGWATPYPVTISTFRGGLKFTEICGDHVNLMGAFRDPAGPAAWPLTIYMEDEASHLLYCSPANRFYECLQMGLAQVIDESAVPTLRRAGFDVPMEWRVLDKKGVKSALRHWQEIRDGQQATWHARFDASLRVQFHKAFKESFK